MSEDVTTKQVQVSPKPDRKSVEAYKRRLEQAMAQVRFERRSALAAELAKYPDGLILSAEYAEARKRIIKKTDDESHRLNIQIHRCEMLLREAGE